MDAGGIAYFRNDFLVEEGAYVVTGV